MLCHYFGCPSRVISLNLEYSIGYHHNGDNVREDSAGRQRQMKPKATTPKRCCIRPSKRAFVCSTNFPPPYWEMSYQCRGKNQIPLHTTHFNEALRRTPVADEAMGNNNKTQNLHEFAHDDNANVPPSAPFPQTSSRTLAADEAEGNNKCFVSIWFQATTWTVPTERVVPEFLGNFLGSA